MIPPAFLNLVELDRLELASKCGNGLSWLLNLNLTLTKLVLLDLSNNYEGNIIETDRSVLDEDSFLTCLYCLSLLNYIRAVTLYQLLKLPPRNLESWSIL